MTHKWRIIGVTSVVVAILGAFLGGWIIGGRGGPGDTPDVSLAAGETISTTSAPRTADPAPGATLARVQARGFLKCGVNSVDVPGFTNYLPDGTLSGFDVDFCRAVAAAILGNAEAVEFIPLTAAERWSALGSGVIDVLFRNTTWVQSRDAAGFDFGPTTYYDGQQVLAHSALFRTDSSLSELDGSVVCVNEGSTSARNIQEAASDIGAEIDFVLTADLTEALRAFEQGNCDAITSDGSALSGLRATREPGPGIWVIFPSKPFSREPLGPVYRSDDPGWADIIRWTVYATIIADQKDITSINVYDARIVPPDAEALRLLGGVGELQTSLGLDGEAFYRVIAQVGNYGEIFERNLGPIGIVREGSLNAGIDDLGLIVAPPAR